MTELAIRAFRNPFAWIVSILTTFAEFTISVGEQAGRSRAASELARMGYYDEAKTLMLGKDIHTDV